MEEYFSRAYATIAASSAMTWHDSFLRPQPKCSSAQILDMSRSWEVFDNGVNDFKLEVDAGPLNRRAWVLQERVLSRRVIHFTKSHMYWECGENVRCNDFREML